MGGKSSPDYAGAAVAQGEANEDVVRDQTYANRPTQYTPWGYTTWNPSETIDPSSGEAVTSWEQTQGLTPQLQSILDKQLAVQDGRSDIAGQLTGRLGEEFGQQMDWDNLNPMADAPVNQFTTPEALQRGLDYTGAPEVGDPRDLRARAEQAVYDSAASRLAPQYDSKRQAMEIKLRNQGLGPEDEAYQAQMGGIDMQETDAYNQANFSAIQAGLGEQAQLFGQDTSMRNMATNELDRQGQFANQAANQAFGQTAQANNQNYQQAMQGANYANTLRQQQMTEQMQQRGFSLNEINALLSGQQVGMPQMPSFTNAQAAQPAPIYQGAVDQGNYDAATNPWGAVLDAGSVLGSAAIMRP